MLLLYLMRRDLRVSDNPILHYLSTSENHGFTHLLPIFVFSSQQIEISGFLKSGEISPYPPALSRVSGFWRCGPHRAKFLAQSVWDTKLALERLNSGLVVRVGSTGDIMQQIISGLTSEHNIGAVWMTEEYSNEEQLEQASVAAVCSQNKISFKLWPDEKYFIDDRDIRLGNVWDLPDVFSNYKKTQEPLRERPRPPLPRLQSLLPPFPEKSSIPPQPEPFYMPGDLQAIENRLLSPLGKILVNPPPLPEGAVSSHPFYGGERSAWDRLGHLIKTGAIHRYHSTRNQLTGLDSSTKLSGFLALGCITARQIHRELIELEDGSSSIYESCEGYGKGESEGTRGIRHELLWRDYMRLCTKKFGCGLFHPSGFHHQEGSRRKQRGSVNEHSANRRDLTPECIATIMERFTEGTTGMGLIDASQRELFHTGYTSNRARQNVVSFFAKHLGIDWRYGAEWYEMLLVDYDVSSNWSGWQYFAGVGNDPRGETRIFHPVKQAFAYDKGGLYVRTWVPELRGLKKLENIFQVCTTSIRELEQLGIVDDKMVKHPLKRIEYTPDMPRRPRRRHGHKRNKIQGESESNQNTYARPVKRSQNVPNALVRKVYPVWEDNTTLRGQQ